MAAPGPSAPLLTQAKFDNAPTEKTVAMIFWGAGGTTKRPRGGERVDTIILFSKGNLEGVDNPNNDSIIVSMMIARHSVKRILVDSESFVDILAYVSFVRMSLSLNSLWHVSTPLMGFTGDSTKVEEEITLPVMDGTPPCQSTVFMKFLVVRIPLAYNVILGRSGQNFLDAIIFTKRLLVRFLTSRGVKEMRGERNPMLLYYHTAPNPQAMVALPIPELLDPRESERMGEPAEHLLTFPLGEDPTRTV